MQRVWNKISKINSNYFFYLIFSMEFSLKSDAEFTFSKIKFNKEMERVF